MNILFMLSDMADQEAKIILEIEQMDREEERMAEETPKKTDPKLEEKRRDWKSWPFPEDGGLFEQKPVRSYINAPSASIEWSSPLRSETTSTANIVTFLSLAQNVISPPSSQRY